ncbi:MAG TPA: ABC transporter ATP-binding protein [Xanthobacteraceae bacterium]|nr:ABC transporter ATP-binding protein [Xanthobacteraceae bacterium]
MAAKQISRLELAGFLLSPALFVMIGLMVAEAMLAATTTVFVINAGRRVAAGQFIMGDLVWILTAQSASYVVGVISWIFAERAGYRGFGKYMLRFARENRGKVKLLNEKPSREQVEPFLTGETFQCFFNVMYELEFALKLFLGLVFNSIVLGVEINVSLPFAYVGAFAVLLLMQWILQNPIAHAYLENQRMNNRVTAQGYTAWDNVFSGNSYNLRLWLSGFKSRLREGLTAQIRAIVAREGMSAMSGIVSLAIVFATMTVVAVNNVGNTMLLVALATTLPRQIEMTYELHLLATGWNDFIAIWTRFGGVAANMLPQPDADFDKRIKFDRLVLREGEHANVVSSVGDAMQIALAQPTGRINVRGGNGSGKSSLLASLKTEMRKRAYYWPTTDRLAFKFAGGVVPVDVEEDDEGEPIVVAESMDKKLGFSSGERQLKSLEEIVNATAAQVYLLDEWDANLDAANKVKADALVDALASRARVVEISHRDLAA